MLSRLPLLPGELKNQFKNSKRFYHLNHSSYEHSLNILELSINQYNEILNNCQLIEQSIQEIERSQGLLVLLTNQAIKDKINNFRYLQAKSLNSLQEVTEIIFRQSLLLDPIIRERKNCEGLSGYLGSVISEQSTLTREIVEAQFYLMEISSQDTLLLDRQQFVNFHNNIECFATSKIRSRYHRFGWFTHLINNEKFVPVEIGEKTLPVLSTLKNLFMSKIPSLEGLFFSEGDKFKLGMNQFYRAAGFSSQEQALSKTLLLMDDCYLLEAESLISTPLLINLKKLEQDLVSYQQEVRSKIVTGIGAYFYSIKNQALSKEAERLSWQYANLQNKRLDFIEKILTAYEGHYNHADYKFVPIEKFNELESLIEECESNLNNLPRENIASIRERFSRLKQQYTTKLDVIQPVIDAIYSGLPPFKKAQKVAENGIGYFVCDVKEVASLFDKIKPYLASSKQEAIHIILGLLSGRDLPNLRAIKLKLLPLFEGYRHPTQFLDDFLEKVIKQYVIPRLSNTTDGAFQIVAEFNLDYTNHWLEQKAILLEEAILFCSFAFKNLPLKGNTVSINKKPFLLVKEKLLEQVHLIKNFANVTQGRTYLDNLKGLITETITQDPLTVLRAPVWAAIMTLIADDQLLQFYFETLLNQAILKSSFDLFANDAILACINQKDSVYQLFERKLLAYFRENKWDLNLQLALDKLENKALSQKYRALFIRQFLLEEKFATQYQQSDAELLNFISGIGQEETDALYPFLSDCLSSKNLIHPEALRVVDFLFKGNFTQDSKPLKALADLRRKDVLLRQDAFVVTKEILSLVELNDWDQALDKLQNHFLLSEKNPERSSFHLDVINQVLQKLFDFHLANSSNVKEKEDDMTVRQRRWNFYQKFRVFLQDKPNQSPIVINFKKIESVFLLQTSALSYFVEAIRSLHQKSISDSVDAAALLYPILKDVLSVISPSQQQAVLSLLQLIEGKWVPINNEDLIKNAFYIFAGHADGDKLAQGILKNYVLPRISDRQSIYFSLIYELEPSWLAVILQEEKKTSEDEFYLLSKIFENPELLSNQATLIIGDKTVKPTLEQAMLAIDHIREYEEWLATHELSQDQSKGSLFNGLKFIITSYLDSFDKSERKNAGLLQLIEKYGDPALLDSYLKIWINYLLTTRHHFNDITKDKPFIKYEKREIVQQSIAKFLYNQCSLVAENNQVNEKPFSFKPYKAKFIENPDDFFPLLALLPKDLEEKVLASWLKLQTSWSFACYDALQKIASTEIKQNYRLLHAETTFAQGPEEELLIQLTLPDYSQYESDYSLEGLNSLAIIFDKYLSGPTDTEKTVGYNAILKSLKNATKEPWISFREKARNHLEHLQEGERVKLSCDDFIQKVKTKNYAGATSVIEEWSLLLTKSNPSSIDSLRLNQSIEGSLGELHSYLLELIKLKETATIALVRDYVLSRFPKIENVTQLIALCNDNTTLKFNSKNLMLRDHCQRLRQFETYAWQLLCHLIPDLKVNDIDILMKTVRTIRNRHQEHFYHPDLRLIETRGFHLGFSQDLINLYKRHESTIHSVLNPLLKVYYDFDELGIKNPRIKTTTTQLTTKIKQLEKNFVEKTQELQKERSSLWATFFCKSRTKEMEAAESSLTQNLPQIL